MGRFDERATRPTRGPQHIFKWKVVEPFLGRGRRDSEGFVTPSRAYDRALVEGQTAQLTWIGHASFLFTLSGKRFLVDPLLRDRIGPVKRLAPVGIPHAELPAIDVVLITHNHRDHLDPKSLRLVRENPLFVVPLGNAPAVRAAGAKNVVELDWWQSHDVDGTRITLVPARHWSMRFPWDRNDALWGGFVVQGQEGSVYHSGDTAYWDQFAEIRRRLGVIDWALLPIGAYEPRWFMEPQHMGPEEAVQAACDLEAKHLVAMHWGTFRLTDEPLGEPPIRAREAHRLAGRVDERLWLLDVGESRRL